MPPTPVTSRLAKPKSDDEFEDLTMEVLGRAWATILERHGRRGQRQQGVDLYGMPGRLRGAYAGIQCKRVESLATSDIAAEIAKAEDFQPAIAEYWIVTSLDREAHLQAAVRELSRRRLSEGRFAVRIWFWQDIERELSGHHDLLRKYYRDWMVAAVPTPSEREPMDEEAEVDWETFYVLPTEAGPRASAYLCLVAIPKRAFRLPIDGDLLDEFRSQVGRAFGSSDLKAASLTYSYAADLVWRHAYNGLSRHWRRGENGSIGYAATVESAHQQGRLSLRELALECLMFLRMVREVLVGEAITLHLDFQPGRLLPTPFPLALADRDKRPLSGVPLMLQAADPSVTYQESVRELSCADLKDPFEKLASLLVDRWRVMFNVPDLRVRLLEPDLRAMAKSELGWAADVEIRSVP